MGVDEVGYLGPVSEEFIIGNVYRDESPCPARANSAEFGVRGQTSNAVRASVVRRLGSGCFCGGLDNSRVFESYVQKVDILIWW